MILHLQGCGKVGRCRVVIKKKLRDLIISGLFLFSIVF